MTTDFPFLGPDTIRTSSDEGLAVRAAQQAGFLSLSQQWNAMNYPEKLVVARMISSGSRQKRTMTMANAMAKSGYVIGEASALSGEKAHAKLEQAGEFLSQIGAQISFWRHYLKSKDLDTSNHPNLVTNAVEEIKQLSMILSWTTAVQSGPASNVREMPKRPGTPAFETLQPTGTGD